MKPYVRTYSREHRNALDALACSAGIAIERGIVR